MDERCGRYKYGSIYFEESRIKCKYMLCDSKEPGACTPAEVLAEFTDAFGLGLPSMCFRGLGANGWWESGFSTLDFQAQLDSVAGQVRSKSSQEESDQRLMSLSDERARAALAAWGTLTMLDKNIVDNKVVTAAKSEEVAHALFTYNSAGVEVIRALNHYHYAIAHKKKWFKRGAPKDDPLKALGNKVLATTFDREIALTRSGLREFEEVSKKFEEPGADTVRMPKTAHQLVARCFERDAGKEKQKGENFRLVEHKLVRETGRLLGDPVRTAEALAAGALHKPQQQAPSRCAQDRPGIAQFPGRVCVP